MRLYGYIRTCTTNRSGSYNSIENQRDRICEWVNKNGHELVCFFTDEAVSNYKNLNGTEFVNMLNMIEQCIISPKIDGVIVSSISRISRNIDLCYSFSDNLDTYGVKLISATEDLSYFYNSRDFLLTQKILSNHLKTNKHQR
ncbi:recombinase family protein [Photobacterium alginatilyticum]|uniref:Recombinase family protein n=1 Tax=Photobacterium alginatilyticum TaxID=1775171 RepID=A0ABW9YJA6_9GAMM|nr:recombinase family protein [Photobacterium alginatilyticum]